MKKRIFTIFALSTLLGLSVCNSSCKKDEKDDDKKEQVEDNTPEEKVDEVVASQMATAITDDIKLTLLTGNQTASEQMNQLVDDIKAVQFAGSNALKEEVAKKVAEATKLDAETANKLINAEKPANVKAVLDALTAEQIAQIIGNTPAPAPNAGYEDAQKLAGQYIILTDASASYEQKMAVLEEINTSINTDYKSSTDEAYKEAYIKGAAAATGLTEIQAKIILDSESPKDTIALLLGINKPSDIPTDVPTDTPSEEQPEQPGDNPTDIPEDVPSVDPNEGGNTGGGSNIGGGDTPGTDIPEVPQGPSEDVIAAQADGQVAAAFIKSINGKTLAEVSGDLPTFMAYREKYMNSSNEYKETFKQTLQEQGISEEVTNTFDSDNVDVMSLAMALGVKLF